MHPITTAATSCSRLQPFKGKAFKSNWSGQSKENSIVPIDQKMPKDDAERVVEGALHLSPHLGKRMVAGHIENRSVFVLELLPQDLKIEIDRLTIKDAMKAASFLAGVVGKAHARQMNEATRKRWTKELERYRSKTLDAPSWLWSSVVALIGSHEVAYLEHCRKYANQTSAK
jgi:uncharacterized protein (DUF2252 family)